MDVKVDANDVIAALAMRLADEIRENAILRVQNDILVRQVSAASEQNPNTEEPREAR